MSERTYIAIDLKSFYASVECIDRGLDPMTTNLVVADKSRTEKTICLAVSPSLKANGIPGRARLFQVVQKVREGQCQTAAGCPGTETYRFFLPGAGASAGSLSGGGLYNGSSQDGQIYGDQRENLSDLSEIYCSGGYPCLFH